MPVETNNDDKKRVPDGLWTKCPKCEAILHTKELETNLKVCSKCGYGFPLSVRERIDLLLEADSLQEMEASMEPVDALGFADSQPYKHRLKTYQKKTGRKEAAIIGEGQMGPHRVAIGILDFSFMGGSMGSVVGEKITRIIELARDRKIPLIIVSASGGARMQESILSLFQMAKTSAALAKLKEAKIPFISVLTDPTTGGVTASFAMLGDVIVAEPKALLAFAGPRVIEQTIRQTLPHGFQQSEFLLKHGMVDVVTERNQLKPTLVRLLNFLYPPNRKN
ncbi:MAG TPA: acetyl-CoA carboxylase, carboxyltransferase subunit beta [Elusimicrobiota bacterium]|nr:acetyl-CoA carboxylase, carboxyltransferase subunit beta [Elusimicrobiota bacterium]